MKSFSRPERAGSVQTSRRFRRPRNVAAVTAVTVAGALRVLSPAGTEEYAVPAELAQATWSVSV